MLATLTARRRSATRTGCSRSSGTATGSRPSSTTARSVSGRATARTARRTSRVCSRRRPGSTPTRRSSTARSWRSTREGRPDFGLPAVADQPRRTGPPKDRNGKDKNGTEPPREAPLVYQVFDLLYLDGRSLLAVPLEERKRLLRSVLREQSRVKFAAHIDGDGTTFYAVAKERNLEGIIAKHRRGHYEPGKRTALWLKVKVRPEQELVVGGYLPGEGTHEELGALLVGVYEGDTLRYAGRVGSGIDTRTRDQLRPYGSTHSCVKRRPPDPAPDRKGDLREARWVDPKIVIRAEFSNWTRDDLVRQAAFKGFEPEKAHESSSGSARSPVDAEVLAADEREAKAAAKNRPGATKHPRGRYGQAAKTSKPKPKGCGEGGHQPPCRARPPRRRLTRNNQPVARRDPPEHGRSSPRVTDRAPRASGRSGGRGAEAHEPRQGPLPAGRGESGAGHEARADPLLRPDRAGDAAPPRRTGRSTCIATRTGQMGRPSGRRTSRRRRRRGWRLARGGRLEEREANDHLRSPIAWPRLCVAGQPGRVRDPRLDVAVSTSSPMPGRDVRPHRHRPRHEDHLGSRPPSARGCTANGARPPLVRGYPEDDRQAGDPGLDPDRAGIRLSRDTSGWAERAWRADRCDGPGAGVLGLGEGEPRREGA